MRTSLIIVGIIFLVIGGLFYFVPLQELKADTTTVSKDSVDTRTSFARVTVPIGWAYAAAIIGALLLLLGLAIPNSPGRREPKWRDAHQRSSETVVKSKESMKIGDGNKRKIVRERIEKHTTNKNEDDEE
jgi:hypothetical protein